MMLQLLPPSHLVVLDKATHQYWVDGVRKRDLSSILAPFVEMPTHPRAQEHIINAKHRGTQIDMLCSWIMEDREDLAREYIFGLTDEQFQAYQRESAPFVEAYEHYWNDFASFPWESRIAVQTPLYCAAFDFCGTPDWHTARMVNDNKATDKCSRVWGLQLAGYELAHGACEDSAIVWLRPKLRRRYEVHRRSEGNRRIFSTLDSDVVKAACQGDYDAEVIQRWRAGE